MYTPFSVHYLSPIPFEKVFLLVQVNPYGFSCIRREYYNAKPTNMKTIIPLVICLIQQFRVPGFTATHVYPLSSGRLLIPVSAT